MLGEHQLLEQIRSAFSGTQSVGYSHDSVEAHLNPAAVLIPLIRTETGVNILLTRRTEHLNHHPGQISFPGGGVENHDPSPIATALRETEEEVGLRQNSVDVVGCLPTYVSVTGFSITPVIGVIETGYTLNIDEFEVAEVFEVPLSFLMQSDNYAEKSILYEGEDRVFHEVFYQHYRIWGVTAAILRNFTAELLKISHQVPDKTENFL